MKAVCRYMLLGTLSVLLTGLSGCIVPPDDVGVGVNVGLDEGFYEPDGYDYGGWGPGYYVGPPVFVGQQGSPPGNYPPGSGPGGPPGHPTGPAWHPGAPTYRPAPPSRPVPPIPWHPSSSGGGGSHRH